MATVALVLAALFLRERIWRQRCEQVVALGLAADSGAEQTVQARGAAVPASSASSGWRCLRRPARARSSARAVASAGERSSAGIPAVTVSRFSVTAPAVGTGLRWGPRNLRHLASPCPACHGVTVSRCHG